MFSKELIKGTLKPLILKLLSDNPRMYGYEITQKVREITRDKIVITEGALYPLLHKLVDENLLQTETVHLGKRKRKYYSLTELGSRTAGEKVREFRDFLATLKTLFDPPEAQLPYHASF